MIITLYVHSSKEAAYDAGAAAGLKDEALRVFSYAAYEVKLDYEVDVQTGKARIIAVDGKELKT